MFDISPKLIIHSWFLLLCEWWGGGSTDISGTQMSSFFTDHKHIWMPPWQTFPLNPVLNDAGRLPQRRWVGSFCLALLQVGKIRFTGLSISETSLKSQLNVHFWMNYSCKDVVCLFVFRLRDRLLSGHSCFIFIFFYALRFIFKILEISTIYFGSVVS